MEKLFFENGIRKFQINNGAVLQFNPSDVNVYLRFIESADMLQKLESQMIQKAEEMETLNGEAVVRLMGETDAEVKKVLRHVFGEQNDFDAIFDGVNVMAVAPNGERVITNFIAAITPIMEEGAKSYAKAKAAGVAGEVKKNRSQRRAKQ